MGKTETIKQRAIYVYLPSIEMVKRWKELAKSQGASISRFVAARALLPQMSVLQAIGEQSSRRVLAGCAAAQGEHG